MFVPTLRGLIIASAVFAVVAAAFALSLFGSFWHASPSMGLVRGLLFLVLLVSLAALGAAWVAWYVHGRNRSADTSAGAQEQRSSVRTTQA